MKQLVVEWRHLEVGGETCVRCADTGRTLEAVISDLQQPLAQKGIEITYCERTLTPNEIADSNSVFINGIPLEQIIPGVTSSENECPSCSSLTGQPSCCRTVSFAGHTYEDIPEALLRQAIIMSAAGLGHS